MRRMRILAILAALAGLAVALTDSPAYADEHTTYNPVPMTKCSGTNAPGNTTTVTLPNGGEITVSVNNCISRDAVTHMYTFFSSLSWTDTDNDRGSTPFASFLLHTEARNTSPVVFSYNNCSITAFMNGSPGSTKCSLGPYKFEGNSGFDSIDLFDAAYIQWDFAHDTTGSKPPHSTSWSPDYVANEFTDMKDATSGCIASVEKPKKYSDGRVYYRAAGACPHDFGAENIVAVSIDLSKDNSPVGPLNKTCTGDPDPLSTVYACVLEGSYADPSGTQSYQTVLYSVQALTPIKRVWVSPSARSATVSY